MNQRLRFRTIMGLSSAIGAEGPAASPPNPLAAGHPSSFPDWLVGGPREVGSVSRAICIAGAEKAIVRLKARATLLSAELAELRQEETVYDRLIDAKTQELSDCQAELESIEAQLATLKEAQA